ncbi:MAG TPA: TAXI family TRAP transporter solute-binding subunit [Hyphomicrobiaceae bacterium]|nr:TAXI family TRAP transporter solute-binding subunit [Hyphomicrobiaceae bacterium]
MLASAALFGAIAAGPAVAQEIKLPATLTLTAYDTGSSGFNIAVAVGKTLKDKHNTEVRVLPAGNDVARLGPLKAGRAQASFMGVGSYFAQERVFEFAVKEWGPQPVQFILASLDCNNISIGIAADSGAKEIKDLKGKRVAFVVGSPALNQNMLAMLAFGGLTRNDVKIVEFASYGASWKGMLNNEIDAAVASNISGQAKETETSPRGLFYPSMPASDTAGWERVRKIGPYFQPHKSTCGTSASKEKPLETSSYPYPILMHYDTLAADTIYNLAKSMIANYDLYKDAAPGAAGLNPKTQNFQWVLPVNPAAVKAFKEAGVWKDADEAHNNRLLARQKVLVEAWAAHEKANPPADADAFRQSWMTARKAALEKAGMEAIFE